MNPRAFFAAASFVAISLYGKAQIVPRSDFELRISPAKLTVRKGTTDSVLISVIRSKTYHDGNAVFNLSSPAQAGFLVSFRPVGLDSCVMIVTAMQEAVPGTYILLPNCILNRKKIAAPLSLTIINPVAP
jgi:hypothetical protein